MISEHSLLAAELLAKALADKGIAVVSKSNTYLSNITGLSDIQNVISAEADLDMNQRIVALFNNSLHNEALAKLVQNINYANSSILNTAKNNVIPLVNFMADKYSEYVANAESNAVLPLNVEVVEDDIFWDNEMFRGAIASLPTEYKAVPLSITFPNKERAEIELMAKTGLARYDNQFAESLARYEASSGVDVYKDVWDTVFAKDGSRNIYNLETYYTGNQEVIAYHLPVLWAVLKYLTNESNIPSGLVCSIAEYRIFITESLSSVNAMLSSFLEGHDRAVKNKKLILTFPAGLVDGKRKQLIRVKKSVYEEFLKQGGDVDAILGSAISDRTDDLEGILANKEAYAQGWRGHHALVHSTVTSEIREIKRAGVKRALLETAQEYDKQQLAASNPEIDPNSVTEFRFGYWADIPEGIQQYVDNLDEHKLSEINYISQQLICDLLFPETDVYKILDLVNEYGKKDPESTPKTALTLALTDYIVNWLTDQLGFEKS